MGTVSTLNVSATNNRNAAQLEQTNGLQTCLNQFNDYTPSLIRTLPREALERRMAAQLRFDFKVNNDLSVYVMGNVANRDAKNADQTLNLGNIAVNPAGSTTQTVPAGANALNTPRVVNTGLGYSFISNGPLPNHGYRYGHHPNHNRLRRGNGYVEYRR